MLASWRVSLKRLILLLGICYMIHVINPSYSAAKHRKHHVHAGKSNNAVDNDKKYFLSIITMVRDEVNIILEFMQHYIEEGVDHVYLFDDGSTDGTIEALRSCVPERYYTVFTKDDLSFEDYDWFEEHNHHATLQFNVLYELYGRLGARQDSEWVMVIDVDELMVSRARPALTVREVLSQELSGCDIVSMPWLIFTWGEHNRTVPNSARYRLFDRWGFEDRFAVGSCNGKFANINRWVPVKAVVRTSATNFITGVHRADFRTGLQGEDSHHSGTFCFPHTQERLTCAAQCPNAINDSQLMSPIDLHAADRHLPCKSLDIPCNESGVLPLRCPARNRLLAYNSPHEVKVMEEDIDDLLLGIHHYKMISYERFQRKSNFTRNFSDRYRNDYQDMSEVNRMDVKDDFMLSQRLPARSTSHLFYEAKRIADACPTHFRY